MIIELGRMKIDSIFERFNPHSNWVCLYACMYIKAAFSRSYQKTLSAIHKHNSHILQKNKIKKTTDMGLKGSKNVYFNSIYIQGI